jgi:hypothetical protein
MLGMDLQNQQTADKKQLRISSGKNLQPKLASVFAFYWNAHK